MLVPIVGVVIVKVDVLRQGYVAKQHPMPKIPNRDLRTLISEPLHLVWLNTTTPFDSQTVFVS